MGFSARKRKKVGPLSLNLSTKGIGVSAGVAGARLSVGPSGTFVTLGRQGFRYRKKIADFSEGARDENIPDNDLAQGTNLNRIESADIENFQNSSSANLLNEIKEKNSLGGFSRISLIISIAVFIIALLAGFPAWLDLIIIIVSIASYSHYKKQDTEKKTLSVVYELDNHIESAFEKMNNGFNELQKTAKIWRIQTEQSNSDRKRNYGAARSVGRKDFKILKELPPFFNSNIIPYGFKVDNKQYYFFPDKILIYQGKDVGMSHYSELNVTTNTTRFIEDEVVPKDAEAVGQTWKYVNSDGRPDKRFKDNRELPILLYSEVDLSTSSGINLKLQASNKNVGQIFARSFDDMRQINMNEVQPT